LYQLATGGGKTVVFSYITESAARRGNRIIILVHRQELIRQSSASLNEIGVPHGIIAPGFTPDPLANVQIASVQTLVRRLDKTLPPNLIIVDECHHARAATWAKVLSHFSTANVLGVTATPIRLSGEGLGRHVGGHFDSMVNGPALSELITRGYLSPPRIYTPPVGADLSNLHKRMGEFIQAEVLAALDKPKITGDAVAHYKRICHNTPAIVFCASVAHAEHVADQFRQAGYQAASVDGTMHDNDRKGRIKALGNGGLHILTSCDLISEGTDIPVVGAAILLRPTASLSLVFQQVGRALRVSPGKQCAHIIDHVGNIHRHNLHGLGRAEWDPEWSLDGEVKRKKKAGEAALGYRQCCMCYIVHAPAPVCPSCGHVYESNAREIDQVDGELVELDIARLRQFEENRRKEFRNRQRQKEEHACKSYKELRDLFVSRGENPGRAWYLWQAWEKRRGGKAAAPMLPGV